MFSISQKRFDEKSNFKNQPSWQEDANSGSFCLNLFDTNSAPFTLEAVSLL